MSPMSVRKFRRWLAIAVGASIAQLLQAEESGLSVRAPTGDARKSDAAMTVVVFNESAADSGDLARFYASKRGIAKDHVLGLKCSLAEEISRDEYDRDIAEPLRKIFKERGWWTLREADHPLGRVGASEIHFVALIRGIPLRIAQTGGYEGDKPNGPAAVSTRNEASVDSELAALGLYTRSISGILRNPYFHSFTPIADARMPALLLVCRLDAPTPEIVKRMITDAIATERVGLRGFAYIDARGLKDGGLMEGEKWLFNIADDARKRGTPVILDNGEGLFPEAYPMRYAALYFGWYAENVSGAVARPDFKFPPGAVAVHIHSFSAVTLRDPKKFWCAPLLAAGAAATLGNVAEPYLSLTPNLDVFHERLREGLTFAESAWASELALSWMTTCIGDPLYRPFQADHDLVTPPPKNEWTIYADGAKAWIRNPAEGGAELAAAAEKARSGIIFEGLGLLQIVVGQPAAAVEAFASAQRDYTNPEDKIRAVIHAVIQLRGLGKNADALALTHKLLGQYPTAPASGILRMFEAQMAPPAAAPAR